MEKDTERSRKILKLALIGLILFIIIITVISFIFIKKNEEEKKKIYHTGEPTEEHISKLEFEGRYILESEIGTYHSANILTYLEKVIFSNTEDNHSNSTITGSIENLKYDEKENPSVISFAFLMSNKNSYQVKVIYDFNQFTEKADIFTIITGEKSKNTYYYTSLTEEEYSKSNIKEKVSSTLHLTSDMINYETEEE